MRSVAVVAGLITTLAGFAAREIYHLKATAFIVEWWRYVPTDGEAPRNTLAGPMIPQDIWMIGALGFGLIVAGPAILIIDWFLERQ